MKGSIYLNASEVKDLGVFDSEEHVVLINFDWYYSPVDDQHAAHSRPFHGWYILGFRRIHQGQRRFRP